MLMGLVIGGRREKDLNKDLDREVMGMNLVIAKILNRACNISTYEVGK